MENNLLIIHGGGPTAVINSSLYGAVTEAQKAGVYTHIYAAKNGCGGLLGEELIPMEDIPEEQLRLLLQTPGSAIGTSRDQLEEAEYREMARILSKYNIHHVLMNGGNGTMDTCGKLYHACLDAGMPIQVMGIPKTMDNDIAVTDHSPGYGSAARYIAASTRELCADVQGLSIHVVVMEASGRNAGWITAASALAGEVQEDGTITGGPDLIYLPERPFSEEQFLADIQKLLQVKKGIVVVVSEGLHDAEGKPIVKPIFKTGRATYFGDVSSHLANLVIKELGYKARGEKPGLLGRCSMTLLSAVDQQEAETAGREALKALVRGETGKMVAFRRISTEPYRAEPFLVPIEEVMLTEKTMPTEFINEEGNGVTKEFIDWVRPLIGGDLPEMIHFN